MAKEDKKVDGGVTPAMPWVLVDASYLGHRAMHSMGYLSHNDVPTGVLYGFFEQLLTICVDPRIRSNKVAVCFDSKLSFRRDVYKKYKKKRHKDRDEAKRKMIDAMHQQMDYLRGVLPKIGFRIMIQKGLESDDMMAQAAKQLEYKADKAIIVTADSDLFQCLTNTIHWYDPARNIYLDAPRLWARKGVHAEQWDALRALSGCRTDGVKGLGGIGDKTAIAFLAGDVSKKIHAKITSKEGKIIYNRNLGLVSLPHAKTKEVDLSPVTYDPEVFYKMLRSKGIKSYLDGQKRKKWDMFFAGQFSAGTTRIAARARA